MSVSFGGFNRETATFRTTTEIEQGIPVTMRTNATVEPAASGAAFCGIVDNCDGSYAAVQIYGEVTVAYEGTAPGVGYVKLGASNTGVKLSEAGREYLVLSVDEATSTVTFLM